MKHRLINKNGKKAILAGLTTLSASAAMAVSGNHASAADLPDNLLGNIHNHNTDKEIIPDNAKNIFQHNKQTISKVPTGDLKLNGINAKPVTNNPLKTFNDIADNIAGLFANTNRKNETTNQFKVGLKASNPIIKTEDLQKVEILTQELPTIIAPAFSNLDNFFKFITLNQEFIGTEILNRKKDY